MIRRFAEAVRRRRLPAGASAGRLARFAAVPSVHLDGPRDVEVLLPPGYREQDERAYPVLYLQDGQNLFDPETSFVRGRHWRLEETVPRLIREGRVEPLIVVGVANGRERRVEEYTPTRDARRREGGLAERYGRFLRGELMPFVASRFRTARGGRNTGIGGSSLGALVSLHLALTHPETFGRVAALSPSVWWDRNAIVRTVRRLRQRPDIRIWLDIGSEEGRPEVKRARLLRDVLRAKGWGGRRLRYLEAEGAVHDEAAWAERAGAVLEFLFPPRPRLRNLLAPRERR